MEEGEAAASQGTWPPPSSSSSSSLALQRTPGGTASAPQAQRLLRAHSARVLEDAHERQRAESRRMYAMPVCVLMRTSTVWKKTTSLAGLARK